MTDTENPPGRSRGRFRVRRVVAWTAGALVVVAVGIWILFDLVYDDTTTPVDASAVIESFRESFAEAGVGPLDAALPAPGVYTYATSGSEAVDALGGTTHDYPATSTVTVRPAGCGVSVRWDAIEERWEEYLLCDDDGALVLTRYATFHRFFGQDDRRDYRCPEPVVVVPVDPRPGDTWATTCEEGSFDEVNTVTVVGFEQVDVGGDAVEAVRVEIDMTVDSPNGDPEGGSVTELWFSLEDRTILRWTETTETVAGSFVGPVTLTEDFELVLSDLDPVR